MYWIIPGASRSLGERRLLPIGRLVFVPGTETMNVAGLRLNCVQRKYSPTRIPVTASAMKQLIALRTVQDWASGPIDQLVNSPICQLAFDTRVIRDGDAPSRQRFMWPHTTCSPPSREPRSFPVSGVEWMLNPACLASA